MTFVVDVFSKKANAKSLEDLEAGRWIMIHLDETGTVTEVGCIYQQ